MFTPRRYKHLLLISRQLSYLLDKGESKDSAFAKLQDSLASNQTQELDIIKQLLSDDTNEVNLPYTTGPLSALRRLINPLKQQGGDVVKFFGEFNKIFLNQESIHYIKNYDTSGIMAYLIMLIVIASGVVTIYGVYVFPSIEKLFLDADAALPSISLFTFTLLKDWGVVLGISLVVILAFFITMAIKIKNNISSLKFFNSWILHFPGFKSIAKQYNLYITLRFIQLMMRSGLSPEKAKQVIIDLLDSSNINLENQLRELNNTQQENLLDEPLRFASTLDNLDREIDFQIEILYDKGMTDFARLKDTISFIGIVIVAVVIGNLIISMYMPIFKMGKIIGG